MPRRTLSRPPSTSSRRLGFEIEDQPLLRPPGDAGTEADVEGLVDLVLVELYRHHRSRPARHQPKVLRDIEFPGTNLPAVGGIVIRMQRDQP